MITQNLENPLQATLIYPPNFEDLYSETNTFYVVVIQKARSS